MGLQRGAEVAPEPETPPQTPGRQQPQPLSPHRHSSYSVARTPLQGGPPASAAADRWIAVLGDSSDSNDQAPQQPPAAAPKLQQQPQGGSSLQQPGCLAAELEAGCWADESESEEDAAAALFCHELLSPLGEGGDAAAAAAGFGMAFGAARAGCRLSMASSRRSSHDAWHPFSPPPALLAAALQRPPPPPPPVTPPPPPPQRTESPLHDDFFAAFLNCGPETDIGGGGDNDYYTAAME